MKRWGYFNNEIDAKKFIDNKHIINLGNGMYELKEITSRNNGDIIFVLKVSNSVYKELVEQIAPIPCQQCYGRGCMECNYTGMCRHCQDISYSDEQEPARQIVIVNLIKGAK